MAKPMTRNEFITRAALLGLGLPLLSCKTKGKEEKPVEGNEASEKISYWKTLGLQVFALRQMLADDPQDVFENLADIGIKNIELFDPSTLNQFVPIIKDLGMEVNCTHFLPGYITGKWDTVKKLGMVPPVNYHFENILEDCVSNGIKYLGIAIMMPEERQNLDDYLRFAELANQHGELSKKSGVQLYYHNHSFEFKPTKGKIPYNVMVGAFDKDLVKLELDVFWASIAHQNPVEIIEELGNQIIFLHLKDLKKGTPLDYSVFDVDPTNFVELGQGTIDFPAIFEASKKAGIKYAFIDQDHTQLGKMESVQKNFDYMKNLNE